MRKSFPNYCALPFVHVAIEGNGDIKGCCVSTTFVANDGTNFNLNRHDLKDLEHTKDYQEFRQSFLENRKSPKCQTCWQQEEKGLSSLRKTFTQRFGYLDDGSRNVKPRFIEIKMGNACNLMCAICHPENSTKWVLEMLRRNPQSGAEEANRTAQFIKREGLWDHDMILQARELHLMGGEPFAIKEIEALIDLIIAKGDPSGVKIWFNTNGTVFPERLFKKLEAFPAVLISVSVDDIHQRMEYQRYYANFQRVLKNLELFSQLRKDKFFISIDVCWSLWNVFYLKDIIHFYEDIYERILGQDRLTMQRSRHFYSGELYSLNNLSNVEKHHYRQALQDAQRALDPGYQGLIGELTSWLDSEPDFPGIVEQRKQEICRLDEKRALKFHQVFPELDAFMEQEVFNQSVAQQAASLATL